MSYSLPTTSFTRQELATIQRGPIQVLLSAINRNMPLDVVFGPARLGDIGLRHLYVEQVYLKTSALLRHKRQNSRLGQMIWLAIQWTQVTAGVGFALLAEHGWFLPASCSRQMTFLPP
jgi:hypothetical protein